ncbi:MAG: hypothetical protein GDA52_03325 [Rhodobacteraceae bacterium]|nr:hypothetical protein [Paracoccaceae bacterium]
MNQNKDAADDTQKSDISNTPVPDVPEYSGKSRTEEAQLDHERETFKDELGWLGRPFGGRREKPGNLSGLALILCFVFLAMAYVYPPPRTALVSFQVSH